MTAIHPADDNGVDLGSSSYSYKDLYVDGTANIASMNMGVNSTITSSGTFNGTATIIPINSSNGNITITIDTEQLVAGRILIFRQISGNNLSITIETEGSEQISAGTYTGDTITLGSQVSKQLFIFSDGSNWYDIVQG